MACSWKPYCWCLMGILGVVNGDFGLLEEELLVFNGDFGVDGVFNGDVGVDGVFNGDFG